MTEAQKETLKFYTTNDYLLINGLLWGENDETIDAFIKIINEDGRGVMKEALEMGADVRWNCSKEDGARLLKIYQRRFPLIDSEHIKGEIIRRAGNDIANLKACLKPLESQLVLYRNIKTKFVSDLAEGQLFNCLGFSSCSLDPHIAENANYGSSNCTLAQIVAPAGTPAIRLDLMQDVQNEPDEVILAPATFLVTKVEKEKNTIYMSCCETEAK